jgi:hypothetical protein
MTKIGAYPVETKTMEQRNRCRNPNDVYQKNFVPAKNGASFIDYPEHKVALLERGDPDTLRDVAEELAKKGLRGRYQIRAARGGVGGGRGIHGVKWGMRLGTISTQGKGFPLIVRELWVG